jgi:hypothetical protein
MNYLSTSSITRSNHSECYVIDLCFLTLYITILVHYTMFIMYCKNYWRARIYCRYFICVLWEIIHVQLWCWFQASHFEYVLETWIEPQLMENTPKFTCVLNEVQYKHHWHFTCINWLFQLLPHLNGNIWG